MSRVLEVEKPWDNLIRNSSNLWFLEIWSLTCCPSMPQSLIFNPCCSFSNCACGHYLSSQLPWPGKERLLNGFSGKMPGLDFCFKKSLWPLAGERTEGGVSSGVWGAEGRLHPQGVSEASGGRRLWKAEFHAYKLGAPVMLIKVEPPPLSNPVESEFPQTENLCLRSCPGWFCHQINPGRYRCVYSAFCEVLCRAPWDGEGAWSDSWGSGAGDTAVNKQAIILDTRGFQYGRLIYREHEGCKPEFMKRKGLSGRKMNKPAKNLLPYPSSLQNYIQPLCQFQDTGQRERRRGSAQSLGQRSTFPCHLNGQLLVSTLFQQERFN